MVMLYDVFQERTILLSRRLLGRFNQPFSLTLPFFGSIFAMSIHRPKRCGSGGKTLNLSVFVLKSAIALQVGYPPASNAVWAGLSVTQFVVTDAYMDRFSIIAVSAGSAVRSRYWPGVVTPIGHSGKAGFSTSMENYITY
jgi:hypothetical protein